VRPIAGLGEAKKIVVPDPMEHPTLDVADTAALLEVSPDTIYDAINAGTFIVEALRLGRRIRIPTLPLLERLGLA
jgi:hypothetical protein